MDGGLARLSKGEERRMKVSVQGIERNDAKVSGPREVVYDVKTEIDAQERTFEVCVSIEQIGSSPVPCAMFRDPSEMRIFRHDQRPITAILRGVLDVYNREQAMLPA